LLFSCMVVALAKVNADDATPLMLNLTSVVFKYGNVNE
jgi:hypothetical protein